MDKKFGQKLNHIWEELRSLPEALGEKMSTALVKVATSIDENAVAQRETKAVLDKLLITSESDDKKRTIEGAVTVEGLYDEVNKALKDNAPEGFDYPELREMFRVLGEQIGDTKVEFDPKAIAQELVKVLPKPEKLVIDKKIEVFGKTLTKLEGNDAKHPLYVEVVNASDLKGSGAVSVSQGGSIPDDLIESDGAGGRQLKVSSSAGGGFANVGIKNAADVRINPATAENQQTDALTATELDASQTSAAVKGINNYRYAGGKSSKTLTTSAGGNLDAITPATGKKIRIFWVAFVPNSDNGNANLVKLGFGTTGGSITNEVYRGYALAHWEVFDGDVDQSVIINTATAEAVAVTIHYQEI